MWSVPNESLTTSTMAIGYSMGYSWLNGRTDFGNIFVCFGEYGILVHLMHEEKTK
jgi:hypothetical protein